MSVLCIGGHNDGRIVDVDERKRDGETHDLTYRVKLKGEGVAPEDIYSLAHPESDAKLTFSTERYTVRDIHFTDHKLVRVLVIHPSADYV
jgi:hypothetical protein